MPINYRFLPISGIPLHRLDGYGAVRLPFERLRKVNPDGLGKSVHRLATEIGDVVSGERGTCREREGSLLTVSELEIRLTRDSFGHIFEDC